MIIQKREFPQTCKYETELAGRALSFETGKLAELANSAVLVRYGETTVLCTVTASERPRDGIDYFPLSVDFEEKLYSVGRIPGGYLRREGRPSNQAILVSRVIDRPMRPLFPSDLRNDVIVCCTVLSVDRDCSPEIAAMLGASCATHISDVPWGGPIAGIQLGYSDGKYLFNPTLAERETSQMTVTIAATKEKVVMIEAAANEIPEDVMYGGIVEAHKLLQPIIALFETMRSEIGKEKFSYDHAAFNDELYNELYHNRLDRVERAMDTDDKNIREARMKEFYDEIKETLGGQFGDDIDTYWEELKYRLQKKVVKRWLLDGKRVDGRAMNEIRPLAAEVGMIPRVHGSGLFTRGQTQVLSICTLDTMQMAQNFDTIFDEESKRYLHHYNFPGFSVGEAKPSRSPGRREIGHGALAENALIPVLPAVEDFPYAIRVVSEVLSSNGSTSQGSVCGSTLALMDAGVPIKRPVAGISCGLITDSDTNRWTTFIDIQGVEDFHGEMDFKVAGTAVGITAIQMDLKNDGLTFEVIKNALEITREARVQILDEIMLPVIAEPRKELSQYAPKMVSVRIDVEKIREVIGSGGKVVQKIVAESGAKVDIEEDGMIYISAIDIECCLKAKAMIENIVFVPKVGEMYYGQVVRILPIGAFVDLVPGKDGMIHISKLEPRRVEKVEDVLNVGDWTWVKVMEIDDRGRVNLSRRDPDVQRKIQLGEKPA
ncbi:MAG: polyribonucleotide nucleotidyltransferase [Oscillospiraceae bacterium]|jgi:polyribonucleotide nucleotidyltransferase|nr:polyribonucleotide nucleotidyltransferase [Oscillospiraceae bacterium]